MYVVHVCCAFECPTWACPCEGDFVRYQLDEIPLQRVINREKECHRRAEVHDAPRGPSEKSRHAFRAHCLESTVEWARVGKNLWVGAAHLRSRRCTHLHVQLRTDTTGRARVLRRMNPTHLQAGLDDINWRGKQGSSRGGDERVEHAKPHR